MVQLLEAGESVLLYGGTNAGKTTCLRKLIEAMATKERPALVNVTDKGGTVSILKPLVDKGICKLNIYHPKVNSFIWIENICNGKFFDGEKWVSAECEKLSLWATESLSGCGDLTLNSLGAQAAAGFNVGGEPAPALKIQTPEQTLAVNGSSRSHYLVAQRWLLEKVWNSQLLPCPQVWTSHEDIVMLDRKQADGERVIEIAGSLGIKGVIGPMVAGSALTANLPKYFVFTFRLAVLPADASNKHLLFTGRHKDGSLEGLANARCDVNVKYEPADLVRVLQDIRMKLKG